MLAGRALEARQWHGGLSTPGSSPRQSRRECHQWQRWSPSAIIMAFCCRLR